VGAVIGREGRTTVRLTHRGACFAATDRSHRVPHRLWERVSARERLTAISLTPSLKLYCLPLPDPLKTLHTFTHPFLLIDRSIKIN